MNYHYLLFDKQEQRDAERDLFTDFRNLRDLYFSARDLLTGDALLDYSYEPEYDSRMGQYEATRVSDPDLGLPEQISLLING